MVEKLLSLTSSPTITTTPRSVRHTLDPSIIAPTTTMTTSTLQHTQHTHRHHHHHAHLNFYDELLASTEILFTNKLTLLLLLGPAAIIGDATGLLGEAACFALAGIALIPCAERLSYITEQCALHTNETTGALLNATFGNCPELLISVAALRSGYYRVVQLAMLGSIITNMIFVFGASCFIGGLHWQVQELRIPSGNVNVVMLLVATAGTLFPAALALSTSSSSSLSGRSQQQQMSSNADELSSSSSSQPLLLVDYYYGVPSPEEVAFSRLNAAVMLTLYMCFLIFQLGTHKEEFDDDNDENKQNNLQITTPTSPMRYYHGVGQQYRRRARSNLFCLRYMGHAKRIVLQQQQRQQQQSSSADDSSSLEEYNYTNNNPKRLRKNKMRQSDVDMPAFDASFGNSDDYDSNNDGDEEEELLLRKISGEHSKNGSGVAQEEEDGWWCRRRQHYAETATRVPNSPLSVRSNNNNNNNTTPVPKMKTSAIEFADGSSNHDDYDGQSHEKHHHHHHHFSAERGGMSSNGSLISMRVGVTWLFIITLCVSAITDILVDTIDGFAHRLNVSEVFTSMVVIPFFSNVAEQVSAFIFAYRNEMDLCIGVTVGSAIQIATFVLPGSVIIGMMMDRSMTLLFRPYETVSLFFGTVMVGAILQGGTTNWLTGAMLVGTYVIFASGVWYHEVEVLTVDAELTMHGYNATRLL